jgi:carboxyl-terminal processing protease
MNFLRSTNTIAVTLLVALLSGIIGWRVGSLSIDYQWKNYRPSVNFSNQAPPSTENIDFKLFWDVWNLVSREYVDKKAIDPKKMYYGAIQGMVAAVGDPYTVFLPPESQKAISEDLGGSFEGVGIELGYNKDKLLSVIAPLPGSPAEKAGVQPGDIIVKINGKEASNTSLPDAVSQIRGPKGTSVSLELFRDGDTKTRTVDLTRDTIVVKSVNYQTKTTASGKKIGYIKLARFGERTDEEWNQAVSDALGAGVQGIILDLRNDPGGYFEDAIYVASEFIEKGNVVQQENAQGQKQGFPSRGNGKLTKLPLIVLINKGSASSSEIVAGAIQDYKKGKLLGNQSFGKGTIQESQNLPGGTGIHITTAKWLTPLDRWIHGIGLTPDIKVDAGDDRSKDPQLDEALKNLDN